MEGYVTSADTTTSLHFLQNERTEQMKISRLAAVAICQAAGYKTINAETPSAKLTANFNKLIDPAHFATYVDEEATEGDADLNAIRVSIGEKIAEAVVEHGEAAVKADVSLVGISIDDDGVEEALTETDSGETETTVDPEKAAAEAEVAEKKAAEKAKKDAEKAAKAEAKAKEKAEAKAAKDAEKAAAKEAKAKEKAEAKAAKEAEKAEKKAARAAEKAAKAEQRAKEKAEREAARGPKWIHCACRALVEAQTGAEGEAGKLDKVDKVTADMIKRTCELKGSENEKQAKEFLNRIIWNIRVMDEVAAEFKKESA